MDSIIYYKEGVVYDKSTAVLKILRTIGGVWAVFGVFYIVPKSLRDTMYSWIAKNRYKWFGKKETCRIPTKEELDQFLL